MNRYAKKYKRLNKVRYPHSGFNMGKLCRRMGFQMGMMQLDAIDLGIVSNVCVEYVAKELRSEDIEKAIRELNKMKRQTWKVDGLDPSQYLATLKIMLEKGLVKNAEATNYSGC